jgi:predicted nucleic acid-binding protein
MEPEYLIDTNSVIDYLANKLTPSGMNFLNNVIDAVPNISIITRIEVLGFNAPDKHYRTLTNFMDDSIILNLDNTTAAKSIEIRKVHKIKLPDTIIAATAVVHNFTLITRNISDFRNIEGLRVISPYEL